MSPHQTENDQRNKIRQSTLIQMQSDHATFRSDFSVISHLIAISQLPLFSSHYLLHLQLKKVETDCCSAVLSQSLAAISCYRTHE
jgi:hypothetical protein